jgi:hypothetical protein
MPTDKNELPIDLREIFGDPMHIDPAKASTSQLLYAFANLAARPRLLVGDELSHKMDEQLIKCAKEIDYRLERSAEPQP